MRVGLCWRETGLRGSSLLQSSNWWQPYLEPFWPRWTCKILWTFIPAGPLSSLIWLLLPLACVNLWPKLLTTVPNITLETYNSGGSGWRLEKQISYDISGSPTCFVAEVICFPFDLCKFTTSSWPVPTLTRFYPECPEYSTAVQSVW